MVQEVTTRSWGSRIMGAFWGVLIGFVLIIAAFVLIFWNEGNSLHTAQSLQQIKQIVITVPDSPINKNNNMLVVYFTGQAVTKDILQDSLLGFSLNTVKLDRNVEMYQWEEKVDTSTEKELGGSEKETKTYTYHQVWSDKPINSENFKEPGHQNPTKWAVKPLHQNAKNVTVGAFQLPPALIEKMSGSIPVDISNTNTENIEKKLKKTVQLEDNELYIGADSSIPKIGDMRITVSEVPAQTVSIIAQQTGNSLQPFVTNSGKEVSLLVMGTQSPDMMIHAAEVENRIFTWVLRLVSLIMMMIGVGLLMQPAVVLADVIPFLGTIVGFGTGLIAFTAGFLLWSIGIAIAWFAVRPMWALGLVAVTFVICLMLFMRRKSSGRR